MMMMTMEFGKSTQQNLAEYAAEKSGRDQLLNKLWFAVVRNPAWSEANDGTNDEDGSQHCGRPGPGQEIITDQ